MRDNTPEDDATPIYKLPEVQLVKRVDALEKEVENLAFGVCILAVVVVFMLSEAFQWTKDRLPIT